MEFLSFECEERFKTESSVSYKLLTAISKTELPAWSRSAHGRVRKVVGYLDFHYPGSGHIKAHLCVILSDDYSKEIGPNRFKRAILDFLRDRGLADTITYEANVVCFSQILGFENRVNAEGKSDGLY